jgi:hypothetical protein
MIVFLPSSCRLEWLDDFPSFRIVFFQKPRELFFPQHGFGVAATGAGKSAAGETTAAANASRIREILIFTRTA